MTTVYAYKEPNWFHKNADRQLWKHLTRAYDVDLTMVEHHDTEPPIVESVVVVFDEQGMTSLDDFDHPDDAAYVFGRTHQNDLTSLGHDHSVRIEYPGEPCLFGVQAAAIVLADRKRKHDCHD